MKKFLVPSLLVMFAAALSQQEAKAGFSIDISIGDRHHHHRPPVVIARPPVVVARPPIVVIDPRGHDCGPDRRYVRNCEHSHRPHYSHGRGHGHGHRHAHYNDRRSYDSHRRNSHWRR